MIISAGIASVVPVVGWIAGVSTLVAGEADEIAMNCWQQILHDSELSPEENEQYVANGLPMEVLKRHASLQIVPNAENGAPQCVFRNRIGEKFVVTPTYMMDDTVVTHATPLKEQKLLQ